LLAREWVMLIFSRRIAEAVRIGDDITLKIVKIRSDRQVVLGVEAPREVRVVRPEAKKPKS
jgi:carbon storage regulator CsrA